MDTKVGAAQIQPVHESPHIPEEIVRCILSYLPVKALTRFRYVSKQWSLWVSETKSRKTQKLMVLSADRSKNPDEYSFGTIDQSAAKLEVINTPPPWVGARYVRIHGSCNGLLLIGVNDNLYLWNPCTGRYAHISSYDIYRDYYVAIAGLCFDSNINKYKVVLAWKHSSPDYGAQYVDVGSSEDKFYSWETVDLPYNVESGHCGPVVNDRLHWVVSTRNKNGHFLAPQVVVCFDPQINKFENFPVPDPPNGTDGNRILGLGVLDGCLCMIRCIENALYEGPVQVMGMKDYGVKESWTVLFRIEGVTYSRDLVPCFYTDECKGEILMTVGGSRRGVGFIIVYKTNEGSWKPVISYESSDGTWKPVDGFTKYGEAIVYEETLVVPRCGSTEEDHN